MLTTLNAWIKDRRNRFIADPRLQRFAARYWPFRSIARRRAVVLFDLCAGFIYSQVLYACVQLELLPQLQSGEKSLQQLLPGSGLQPQALRRLLLAAVALELLEQRGPDRFALGAQGAAMLANPGIAAMVRHHRFLYEDLLDPVALLQRQQQPTRLQNFWRYALDNAITVGKLAPASNVQDAEDYQLYSELMASSQHMIAEQVLSAYDFSAHANVLDVGGGVGEFLCRLGQRYPELRLGLYDLPPVIDQARQRAQADTSGISDFFPGDFQRDELPTGFDLITLVRVLHDHDDALVQQLLARCAQALPADGCLLIAEPLAQTPGAKAMGDAYFGLYLYAMGQGRPRTFKEYQGFLQQAGFQRVRLLQTSIPMLCSLVVATVKKKV
mgnify:CR=1 FL=1